MIRQDDGERRNIPLGESQPRADGDGTHARVGLMAGDDRVVPPSGATELRQRRQERLAEALALQQTEGSDDEPLFSSGDLGGATGIPPEVESDDDEELLFSGDAGGATGIPPEPSPEPEGVPPPTHHGRLPPRLNTEIHRPRPQTPPDRRLGLAQALIPALQHPQTWGVVQPLAFLGGHYIDPTILSELTPSEGNLR